jgi:hypothetical protein
MAAVVRSPTAVKIQPMMLPGRRASSTQPTTRNDPNASVRATPWPESWRKRSLITERTTPATLPTRPRASNPQPTRAELLRTVPPRPSESWNPLHEMGNVLQGDRPEIVTNRAAAPAPRVHARRRIINRQAANRRRTACNQTAATDTQQQQAPRSEAGSNHCCWSRGGDACFHTAAAIGSESVILN